MVMLLLAVAVVAFLSCVPTEAAECPLMKCQACKSGYRVDGAGCQTCECVDPCEYPKCKSGEICKKQEIICVKAPCYPLFTCKHPCPQVKCSRRCKSGFRKTYRGCQTCQCVNPCEYPPCAPGETCKSQVVQCFVSPCYNIAKCLAKETTTSTTDATTSI